MKKKTIQIKYLALAALTFAFFSCNEEEDVLEDFGLLPEEVVPVQLTAGSADFSKTVSVGASFTAGFTDNALFIAAQENSFPKMLSEQFAKVGGGTFTQPLMSDNFGGLLAGGNRIADPRLVFNGSGPAPLESLTGPLPIQTDVLVNNPTGPFNNMGVPGAKSFHLVAPGYGNPQGLGVSANPYFVRMASNPNTTVLTDALAQSPTFFTASLIGGNDVLIYATTGGAGVDQTGNFDPTTYGLADITDPNVFAQVYSNIITALTANGAKGVITNIPDVTGLPFFTTVGHDVVPLDGATTGAVNQAYAQYNGGLQLAVQAGLLSAEEAAQRTITFEAIPNNAVVIEDEDLTNLAALGLPNFRQATADDLLVLSSSTVIGTLADPNNPLSVNGVAVPLADNLVLTPTEQMAVKTATDAYNAVIEGVANKMPMLLW